jgi:hypothetical protein
MIQAAVPAFRHIARWDLDKTYLRTEFDTMRDLVKAALERPDEKRTHPGAGTLLREMTRAGISVHILSGSPTQMRKRLEDKLRLDGIRWQSFVLKPNLRNVLRFRFRALRDQLGYKLPALLDARASMADGELRTLSETLFGDDAEADAFVYSLYADVLSGRVDESTLALVCSNGRMYDDVLAHTLACARRIKPQPVVERILIHLERQSLPEDLGAYGSRVIGFYNYLQAAFVVFEDGRIPADGVLAVAQEMVQQHRFDGDQLLRSYQELGRRGCLRGVGAGDLGNALGPYLAAKVDAPKAELTHLVQGLRDAAPEAAALTRAITEETPDYAALVMKHNRRHKKH